MLDTENIQNLKSIYHLINIKNIYLPLYGLYSLKVIKVLKRLTSEYPIYVMLEHTKENNGEISIDFCKGLSYYEIWNNHHLMEKSLSFLDDGLINCT